MTEIGLLRAKCRECSRPVVGTSESFARFPRCPFCGGDFTANPVSIVNDERSANGADE